MVFLSLVFVALMGVIVASIAVCRALVVKSHAEGYGRLWGKAILSEYDRHLLGDYGLMAYQGDDREVAKKLAFYASYSLEDRLDIDLGKPSAYLYPYRMSHPDQFRKALKASFATEAGKHILSKHQRIVRNDTGETSAPRKIGNRVVLDTLRSHGSENATETAFLREIKEGDLAGRIKKSTSGTLPEMMFVKAYLGNHLTAASEKETFFRNEWEYIVKGSEDDAKNFSACRRRIFLIRNVLNLMALYQDPEKVEVIVAAAELITPGPAAALTQILLAEAWAALESEADVQTLVDGGRVPLIKTAGTWKTDLGDVLESDTVTKQLDEDAQKRLVDSKGTLLTAQGKDAIKEVKDGQTYEDYLLFLIMMTGEEVRLLRIMDIVQIDMKIRYYEDFNFEEYYCGIGFNVRANGAKYEIEDAYQ